VRVFIQWVEQHQAPSPAAALAAVASTSAA